MMTDEALLHDVPTLRLEGSRTLHGYQLLIEGNAVKVLTRCGKRTDDEPYTITHGIITCTDCLKGTA